MGAVFNRVTLSATGDTLLASAGQNAGDAGWQLTFAGTSWTGSVVLKQNTAPPGAAVSLSTVSYFNATTGALVAAGTAITSGGSFIVANTGLDLYAVYTHTAGTVQITLGAGSGQYGGVAVSAADITAGTFGAFSGETGTYAFPGAVTVAGALSGVTTLELSSTATAGAAGAAITALQGTAKSGTDQAAGAFTVIANLSTGAGAPGSIQFQGGQVLSTGATVQTAATIWTMRHGTTTAISELVSGQVTARIVGGSTNGLAIRNSANTRDNLSINDAGSLLTLTNGTTSIVVGAQSGLNEMSTGSLITTIAGDLNIGPTVSAGTSGRTVRFVYYNQTSYLSGAEVANVASGFGTLALMKSGGNVVIGGTTAGATTSGALAFSIAATEPTATVDLVHLYGFDFGAGQRALALYQEYAPYAGVAVASTTKIPIRVNGVAYFVLATTVA